MRGRTRVYLTPAEVEAEMQEARERDGFVGEVEINSVRQMVKNAKRNNVMGDKIQLVIDPMNIHIPSWQRQIRIGRALRIGQEYNKYKWDVPKVLLHEGKLLCIDGQHRIYGAFKAGKDAVVVEIMECSLEEAIEIYINQTNDRGRMTPADTYKAAIAAEDPRCLRLREVCHRNGVNVRGDDVNLEEPVGMLTSVSDGLSTAPEMLDRILQLIRKLEWNGNANYTDGRAYSSKFIRVFKKLYTYNAGNERLMERILLANCKGTVWFNDNVASLSQSHVFDKLSSVIAGKARASVSKFTTAKVG